MISTTATVQGMHFNNLTELHQASITLSETLRSQRSSLPKRFYWKETTPQHYATKDGTRILSPGAARYGADPRSQIHAHWNEAGHLELSLAKQS